MNGTQSRERRPDVTGAARRRLASAGVYGVLFVFGAVQGTIGSFQYSRTAGSVPVAALVCCVVILATCLLAGWALSGTGGAMAPAIGWIIASFVLSMPVASGTVIIAATNPGKWYLYGGTVSVAIGVAVSFGVLIRRSGRAPARR